MASVTLWSRRGAAWTTRLAMWSSGVGTARQNFAPGGPATSWNIQTRNP